MTDFRVHYSISGPLGSHLSNDARCLCDHPPLTAQCPIWHYAHYIGERPGLGCSQGRC